MLGTNCQFAPLGFPRLWLALEQTGESGEQRAPAVLMLNLWGVQSQGRQGDADVGLSKGVQRRLSL